MSKLLDEGIKAVRSLPENQQDAAGELLLSLADGRRYDLSPEQVEGIRHAQAQIAEGRYAGADSVERVFGKRFK